MSSRVKLSLKAVTSLLRLRHVAVAGLLALVLSVLASPAVSAVGRGNLSAAAMSGSRPAAGDLWPEFGHDPSHSGVFVGYGHLGLDGFGAGQTMVGTGPLTLIGRRPSRGLQREAGDDRRLRGDLRRNRLGIRLRDQEAVLDAFGGRQCGGVAGRIQRHRLYRRPRWQARRAQRGHRRG